MSQLFWRPKRSQAKGEERSLPLNLKPRASFVRALQTFVAQQQEESERPGYPSQSQVVEELMTRPGNVADLQRVRLAILVNDEQEANRKRSTST